MGVVYSSLSFIFFWFLLGSFSISDAIVPANETFHYVNEGPVVTDPFEPVISEYESTYRLLPPFNYPFRLVFYNTTPNAYTLAIRMGVPREQSLMRWVWEANRGKPVRENATFSLGSDGNLILAEANGQIVWQTNTANKGVVGFALLSNGNIVLLDSKGNFVWQSFDYPTDTRIFCINRCFEQEKSAIRWSNFLFSYLGKLLVDTATFNENSVKKSGHLQKLQNILKVAI